MHKQSLHKASRPVAKASQLVSLRGGGADERGGSFSMEINKGLFFELHQLSMGSVGMMCMVVNYPTPRG